jgi:hypothetical protein
MYRCSNPLCLALHSTDPQGHCPTCRNANGVGFSCTPDAGFTCHKCGTTWPAGQMAMKCVTCQETFCPSCKDVPTVHRFGCP